MMKKVSKKKKKNNYSCKWLLLILLLILIPISCDIYNKYNSKDEVIDIPPKPDDKPIEPINNKDDNNKSTPVIKPPISKPVIKTEPPIIEDVDSDNIDPGELSIRDSDNKWDTTTDLNIFTKSTLDYVVSGKLAPGVSGNYNFTIRNNNTFAVKYSIMFLETNLRNINLKYRLKKGDIYLLGDQDNWLPVKDAIVSDIVLANSKMTNYVLEWKWFDSSHDTEIGISSDSEYGLAIKVVAEEKI